MTDYTKTTGNENLDGFLGCGLGLVIAGALIWAIFFRTPDPEYRSQADAAIERMEERQRIKLNNARYACDRGVQSACVEYAELID